MINIIQRFQHLIRNLISKKQNKKAIGFLLLATIVLISINYYFCINTYGGEHFFVNWQATRLILEKGINPYSSEALNVYSKIASEKDLFPYSIDFYFNSPLFSIILYLPFSFIKNFTLARTAWLIFQEISIFLTGYSIVRILKWDLNIKQIVGLCSIFLFFFFTIINLVSSTSILALNLFLIIIFNLITKERYEIAGLLTPLLFIQINIFLFPTIYLFLYLIKKKAWSFFIWSVISLIFLVTVGMFFIQDWPLSFLRLFIQKPQLFDFQSPGVILRYWVPSASFEIGNIIFLILLSWLIIELLISNFSSPYLFWTFSLTITMSQVIWLRKDLTGLVLLIFPFLYIFYQWTRRDVKIGIPIILVSIVFFSIGLFIISDINTIIQKNEMFNFFIYIVGPIFLLMNLYWMRWWIIKGMMIDG